MPKIKNLYRSPNVNSADETARIVGLDNATIVQRCRAYAESLGIVNVVTIRPATEKELAVFDGVIPYETPMSDKYFKESAGAKKPGRNQTAKSKAEGRARQIKTAQNWL